MSISTILSLLALARPSVAVRTNADGDIVISSKGNDFVIMPQDSVGWRLETVASTSDVLPGQVAFVGSALVARSENGQLVSILDDVPLFSGTGPFVWPVGVQTVVITTPTASELDVQNMPPGARIIRVDNGALNVSTAGSVRRSFSATAGTSVVELLHRSPFTFVETVGVSANGSVSLLGGQIGVDAQQSLSLFGGIADASKSLALGTGAWALTEQTLAFPGLDGDTFALRGETIRSGQAAAGARISFGLNVAPTFDRIVGFRTDIIHYTSVGVVSVSELVGCVEAASSVFVSSRQVTGPNQTWTLSVDDNGFLSGANAAAGTILARTSYFTSAPR